MKIIIAVNLYRPPSPLERGRGRGWICGIIRLGGYKREENKKDKCM